MATAYTTTYVTLILVAQYLLQVQRVIHYYMDVTFRETI